MQEARPHQQEHTFAQELYQPGKARGEGHKLEEGLACLLFGGGHNGLNAPQLLGGNLAGCSEGKEILLRDEAVKGFSRREGIILSTDDSKIKCRLTLDEIIKEMLDEKSEELSLALFCGRLPE